MSTHDKTTDKAAANTAPSTETECSASPKTKSTLTALLKEAMAAKTKQQQVPSNTKKIDKGQKIGMPPRGTRRSMGKR